MEAKIINSKDNQILGRKEITTDLSFEKSTPSRNEIKRFLCSKIGANPDSTVISNITSKFGTKSVIVTLHVYQTKEAALTTEPTYILVREGMAEKKPKKEKKAASPAKKK